MLPGIAVIVWAYAVARLLQVPVEYTGGAKGARAWLIVTSCIGMLIASVALVDIFMGASSSTAAMKAIQP